MRKLKFISAVIGALFLLNTTQAQVSVSVNIGLQPLWGPVGYDYVEYYYLPDAEVYYYVPRHQFIYFSGGNWVRTSSLPSRFGSVNLYTVHKVVINEPTPYKYHDKYKVKYVSFKGNKGQAVIRDSHDEKYYVIKGHPDHGKYKSSPGYSGKSAQPKAKGAPSHGSSSGGPKPKGGGGHGNGKGGGNGHGGGKGKK